ncbi:hypothetical protein CCAN12_610047 [Capnocytophaga canimorsus]|uniref:Uncharacterized protein n=1 Tax=Capnocytophaga canimorsus TaxID=28188 RepID=A0A0B7H7D1_9FLAO|nr:hypothetical protein CLV61_1202 [Capnocytophaga canimorsus]CEN35526.1 hypothetical protein CCAN12_610047 [Capnocytophaga canimorsus]STA71255.1 Uncharacterised protein [Capnocytophaga canimorsus]
MNIFYQFKQSQSPNLSDFNFIKPNTKKLSSYFYYIIQKINKHTAISI